MIALRQQHAAWGGRKIHHRLVALGVKHVPAPSTITNILHRHGLTALTVWLVQLGIRISHSRPYPPQTNGKEERFHRTLKAEVLNSQAFHDVSHAQRAFDQWRPIYNEQRPHEALNFKTSVSRY